MYSVLTFTIPVVISIAAIFLTWSQNEIMTHQAQFTRTFDSIQQYDTGEMLKVRERITETIDAWIADEDMDTDAVTIAMIETFGGDDYKQDFDRFVRFFDYLLVCVRHEGCSRDLAVEFLRYHGRSWWVILGPYIQLRKEQTRPGYGKGLRCLAQGYPDDCLHEALDET